MEQVAREIKEGEREERKARRKEKEEEEEEEPQEAVQEEGVDGEDPGKGGQRREVRNGGMRQLQSVSSTGGREKG